MGMGMYEQPGPRRRRQNYETMQAFLKAVREMNQSARRANDILGDVDDIGEVMTVMTGYPEYMPSFDKFTRDVAKWEIEASRAATRTLKSAGYSYDRRED
jgi:hypothetical protein